MAAEIAPGWWLWPRDAESLVLMIPGSLPPPVWPLKNYPCLPWAGDQPQAMSTTWSAPTTTSSSSSKDPGRLSNSTFLLLATKNKQTKKKTQRQQAQSRSRRQLLSKCIQGSVENGERDPLISLTVNAKPCLQPRFARMLLCLFLSEAHGQG